MGVPVVTTSIGAQGLEARAGKDILIADAPEDFARHVIDLIQSPDLRKKIGDAGRQLVENKYNWQTLAQRLESVYSRICN